MRTFTQITVPATYALLLAVSIVCLPAHAAPVKSSPPAAVKLSKSPSPNTVVAALPPSVPTIPTSSAPPAPAPDAVPANTSEYTGVVIDARALPAILRSPAPAIYGATVDATLVYPDRAHVPTPDEVQDESIVRYYHNWDEAARGVGGSHPLVIKAIAVLGPAKDALQVSPADMQTLLEADKSLHFTRSWRVGFLVPSGN